VLQFNFFLFLLKLRFYCTLESLLHLRFSFLTALLKLFCLGLNIDQLLVNFCFIINWISILWPVWHSQVILLRVLLNCLRFVLYKTVLTAKTSISHFRWALLKLSNTLGVLQVWRSFKLKICGWFTTLRLHGILCSFFGHRNGCWFSGWVRTVEFGFKRLIFLLIFFLLVTNVKLVWWNWNDLVLIFLRLVNLSLYSHFSIIQGSGGRANL